MAGDLVKMIEAIYPRDRVAAAIKKFSADHPIDWERVFNDPAYAEGMADAFTYGVGVVKHGSDVEHIPSSDYFADLSEDSQ